MTEFPHAPNSIFDLDYTQINPIARKVKSKGIQSITTVDRMGSAHPSLADILMKQFLTNVSVEFFGQHEGSYIRGADMAYTTAEEVAAALQIDLPPDPGSIPLSEWIGEANRIQSSGVLPGDNEEFIAQYTSINEFRTQLPQYYKVALAAFARMEVQPVSQIQQLVENDLTFEELSLLFEQAIEGLSDPNHTSLVEAIAFLDGYGRTLLYLKVFETTARLPKP